MKMVIPLFVLYKKMYYMTNMIGIKNCVRPLKILEMGMKL